MSEDDMIAQGVNFEYVIDAYNAMGRPKNFFTSFFELLAGNAKIRQMIESGASAEQIRATWSDDVNAFKAKRKPYLLYPES